jgi:hypothetical protein
MLPAGAKALAEAKMGLLTRDGKTLKPDERKGLLRVIRVRCVFVAGRGGRTGSLCARAGCVFAAVAGA